ncbi:MAG: phosphoglycerate dehydrogenase [Clostridiales bacterium]|nr:phosphoglycerate dehydrogenase [Clostridiales bacterium]
MTKKVLVTLSFPPDFISGFEDCVKLLTDKGFAVEVDARHRSLRTDELIPALQGVYAHVASAETLSADVMDKAPDLRIISRMGVGYDAIDVAAATKRGIALTITPGANADAVAEYTVTLLLALTRHIPEIDAMTRKGEWKTVFGNSIYEKTLGVIGAGDIGRRVVRNLAGFRMRVLAFDPLPDETFARNYGVTYCALEQLLAESDYISIHCPLTDDTTHLLSDKEFSLMKPSVRVVNCARGEIIDEAALYRALADKRIAGAALDVYEKEPFDADNPLFTLDNVVLSPHIAGMTYECRKNVIEMAFQNIIDLSEGRKPAGLINPEACAE